jgi:hypothetical protein
MFVVFIRRLRLPFLLFAESGLLCVRVYRRLEGLRWQDALFWILNPHAIDYHTVHNSTKFLTLFVFMGVFAFQVWIAERVAVMIFSRHGTEVWKSMMNEISLEKVKGHCIICGICGYGQVGRTVMDQLNNLEIPLSSSKPTRGSTVSS